jgi:hypothetical protein
MRVFSPLLTLADIFDTLVASIRRAALPRPLLLAVDGLSSYVTTQAPWPSA